MDDIHFDQLMQELSTAVEKKNLSVLVQKLTFLPLAEFLMSSLRKEQRINSNLISSIERTFKV